MGDLNLDTIFILSALLGNIIVMSGIFARKERRLSKLESTVQNICKHTDLPYFGVKHND